MPAKKASTRPSGAQQLNVKTSTVVPVRSKKRSARGTQTDTPETKITKRTKPTRAKAKVLPAPESTHIVVSDSTPRVSEVLINRTSLQLALLTPFRFPVDTDRLASQVARYTGVFFVIAGAILTLFNMQFVDGGTYAHQSGINQSATTILPECDPLSTLYNADICMTSTSGSGGSTSVDTQPEPDIVIDGPDPLMGTVTVNVYVVDATNVSLYAYYKDGSRTVSFGPAVAQSPGHWKYIWNTTAFDDGEYRLKVSITNQHSNTAYQREDSSYVVVLNHPLTETTTSSSGTSYSTSTDGYTNQGTTASTTATGSSSGSSSTTTTTTTTTTTPDPVLNRVTLDITEDSPLRGYATIEVGVSSATQVKLYALPSGVTTHIFLGYATYHGDDTWRYEWNTRTYPNGSYSLKAQAIFGIGSNYYSEPVSTAILNTTETATTTTTTSSVSSTTSTVSLEPTIGITIPRTNPLSGDVDVLLSVTGASFVELYAIRKNTLTPIFLGLASKQNTTEWKYRWNTKLTPNAEYMVFAKVKHAYGISESRKLTVSVLNENTIVYTPKEETVVEEMEDVATELLDTTKYTAPVSTTPPPIATTTEAPTTASAPTRAEVPPMYITPVTSIVESIEVDLETEDELKNILNAFRADIEDDLRDFARAVRQEDEEEMKRIRDHMSGIRAEAVKTLPLGNDRADIVELIDQHMQRILAELQELAVRNERIIKERIGEAVHNDSDRDGVSDYDEINLYETDPFVADTDGDGFIDGTEIVNGYDPNNGAPETLIAYESPKEVGVIREDILTVDTIIPVEPDPEHVDTDGVIPSAIISGKGLPNSFVTLYIYSTAIVVTVKTDSDGNWSYIFDKELEDGTHEVYVGMTDNAGRVVAKSNPLTFVKTAQAFTPVEAAGDTNLAPSATEPSLLSSHVMLVVGSIAIVALGLVLILLGLHVRPEREGELAMP